MSQPSSEERVNSLIVEARILEGTYNELMARQNLLERALIENRGAMDTVKGLEGKPAEEVLMQIGGGSMLRSSTPSSETVLVGIGSNVVIEKSKDEALAILDGRTREVEKTLMSIISQRNEIADRLNADRQILNNLLAQQDQKE